MAENPNPLEMSDDDFLNADPSEFEDAVDNQDNAEDESDTDDSSSEDNDQDEQDNTDQEDADASEDEDSNADDDTSDEEDDSTSDDVDGDTDDNKDAQQDEPKEPEPKTVPTGELTDAQFIDIGKQVMGEFKANGRNLKMKSADDAIQLMQMGANYHKKMSALKPSLKTLKLLENNGLLDPEKINYLIDLNQKKPEAIKQLLKDSKLDPMEIDLEGEETYTPSKRAVNDKALDLDDVLDSISTSDHYDRTLTVLGDEWDDNSRQAIGEQPEIIRTINNHMNTGIYDQVAETVAYERSLGRLSGISDLEAYQRVGAYMHENNLFTTQKKPQQPTDAQQDPNNRAQSKDDSNVDQQARQSRKKAASPSRRRQSGSSKGKSDYNPLSMSDEEFLKLNNIEI